MIQRMLSTEKRLVFKLIRTVKKLAKWKDNLVSLPHAILVAS